MTENVLYGATSASASSLGFSFQEIYSLELFLKNADRDWQLWVEGQDDIHIQEKDKLILYQLKHRKDSLSDNSSALWKTIGNWCSLIKNNLISIEKTKFKLVITKKLSERQNANQVAKRLCKNYTSYNPTEAFEKLKNIAKENADSEKVDNEQIGYKELSDFEKFLKLSPNKQKRLVDSIEILDNTPEVAELDMTIPNFIQAPENRREEAYHELAGAWQKEIRKQLTSAKNKEKVQPITKQYLDKLLISINPKYFGDGFEIDDRIKSQKTKVINNDEKYNILSRDDEELLGEYPENRKFILHARKILDEDDMQDVVIDYYKANNQRTAWFNKSFQNRVEKYEDDLQDNWQRTVKRIKRKNRVSFDIKEEETQKDIGIDIYNAVEELDIKIKDTINEKYIMMGSYHILADEDKICWYFDEIMQKMLKQ